MTLLQAWQDASRRAFPSGYEQSVRREIVDAGDALADALAAAEQRAEQLAEALRAIVDFPIRENFSGGAHFAEVRLIAREALARADAPTEEDA